MSLLKQGLSQVTAVAKAGMSERTARKYGRSGATTPENEGAAHVTGKNPHSSFRQTDQKP